jgi:sirohydrochlorin ferrochelatase
MRPARLTPAVVLVAHGSRDPRAAAATEALAWAVRHAHPGWRVHATYLDHAGPRPLDVLSSLPAGSRAVLVPLLLTAAYHGRVDVPAVLEAAAGLPIQATLADVLGPLPASLAESGPARQVPPLLLEALLRRMPGAGPQPVDRLFTAECSPAEFSSALGAEAGAGAGAGAGARLDAVVLAAAGTRDAAARETVEEVARALGARLSLPWAVAYASAAPPTAGEAVARLRADGARRVGMAAYFLAPGRLYDIAVRSAREAGAVAVAEPMTDAPELVRLIAARVEAAGVRSLTAA